MALIQQRPRLAADLETARHKYDTFMLYLPGLCVHAIDGYLPDSKESDPDHSGYFPGRNEPPSIKFNAIWDRPQDLYLVDDFGGHPALHPCHGPSLEAFLDHPASLIRASSLTFFDNDDLLIGFEDLSLDYRYTPEDNPTPAAMHPDLPTPPPVDPALAELAMLINYDQAFENTSTSVAASQMRNALNNLADSVEDPAEKKASLYLLESQSMYTDRP